jgi:hypothetical protein
MSVSRTSLAAGVGLVGVLVVFVLASGVEVGRRVGVWVGVGDGLEVGEEFCSEGCDLGVLVGLRVGIGVAPGVCVGVKVSTNSGDGVGVRVCEPPVVATGSEVCELGAARNANPRLLVRPNPIALTASDAIASPPTNHAQKGTGLRVGDANRARMIAPFRADGGSASAMDKALPSAWMKASALS